MNALLIRLLNMSAAGSVLILAVVVLRALLRRAPRWIICAMWALVAIRLICPVSLSSPVSAFRATPSIVGESGEVEVFRPAGGSEKPLLAVDTVQIERPQASSETIREIPGTSYAVTQRSRDAYLPPLVTAYLLGLSAMLLYALVSTLLLRKRVAVSLRQRGNIRICDEVAGPFILGILRPAIYLPSSLSEEERRFVLAHERAHLRRLDHVWKPLGFLILSVHWFNPLCWLSYLLFCRDIELACDEKVIRRLGRAERAAYSQTLLNCSAHRILAACPVAFGETDIKTRVKAVLNYKRPAFWVILAAVLGCLVLVLCFAANPVGNQKSEPTPPPMQETPLPTPELPPEGSGLSENAPAFVPADPEAFLLSFSSGKVIERIDYSEREYADSGKGFDEIISARTWIAHESRGFPASAPDRVVELLRDDFPQDPGWVLRFEESDSEMLCIAWQAYSSSDATWVLDCGENLMDELMPWAMYEAGKPIDETKPRMTLNDVFTLADKGMALTWADLLAFEGKEIGSGQLIWRFPIDDSYCLEAYDGELDGPPERVLLIKADENGEFRAGPGLYIDIFTQDIDAFLSGAQTRSVTVTSGGVTVEPALYLLNETIWTDYGWLVADGIPLAAALEDAEQIPTLTLASDFIIRFDGYSRKSGLRIYDEQFNLLREDWYGDTAVNWLAPGRYYGVIEIFGPAGRYIASEGASEESIYRAVFRLNVDSEGAEPYAPEKAVGLTTASLHTIGEDWVMTDAARLDKLEAWLKNAEPLPGGAGCPFGSVLTLTCADGSRISCCPAEDSCGIVFANGVYYRFAADNKDFWLLFGLMID